MNFKVTHMQLYDKWYNNKDHKTRIDGLIDYVIEIVGPEVDHKEVKRFVSHTCSKIKRKWDASHRHARAFLFKNSTFLNKEVDLSKFLLVNRPKPVVKSEDHFAANDAIPFGTTRMSADKALAMIVDGKLSRSQYDILRLHVPRFYPNYKHVKEAMQLCYPRHINADGKCVNIKLQALVNHTAKRLLATLEHDDKAQLFTSEAETTREVNLVFKWGCFGLHPKEYTISNPEDHQCDTKLFSISLVPIEMFSTDGDKKDIIWTAPITSAARYIRPIMLRFTNESPQIISEEVESIENQILLLKPTIIKNDNKHLCIKPTLASSTIDGELCNAVSSYTPLENCFICGAKRDVNEQSSMINSSNDDNKNMLLSEIGAKRNLVHRILISSDPYLCSFRLDENKTNNPELYDSD